SPDAGDLVGEVAVAMLLEILPAALVVDHDFLGQPDRSLGGHDRKVAWRHDRVNSKQRGLTDRHVHVGSLRLYSVSQDVVQHAHNVTFTWPPACWGLNGATPRFRLLSESHRPSSGPS